MNIARKAQRVDEVPASAADIEAGIGRADTDLRAALLGGLPTGAIRVRVAELNAASGRLATQRAEAEAQRQADEAAAVASAAETIAAQATGRLAARQPRPIQHPKDLASMQHPPEITAAAGQVAAAATRAAAADARVAGAAEAEAVALTRLDALASKRAAIVARRQSGQHDAADGADLALLAADGEGLAPLLTAAQAATAAARAEAEEARRLLGIARESLAHVEAELELAALVDHLSKLDGAVVGALGRLADLQRTLGRSGLSYTPSPELAHGLRRLLAAAGRL